MTMNKPYPGMICSGVEFFVVEDEDKIIQGGKIIDFDQAPYPVLLILQEVIDSEPQTKAELMLMHPDSEHKRLRRLVRCRFGGLDHVPDIKDGVLQEGEFWPCPNRGSCSGEGIICRQPKYNDAELTSKDIRLMKLLASNLTNEQIAEEMESPLGSFHKIKTVLYEKLGGVQTKQEVALIAIALNLI